MAWRSSRPGSSGEGHDLVVDQPRDFEADAAAILLEREHAAAAERLGAPDPAARRDLEPYPLGPDGVRALDHAPGQIGGGVVEQMQRVPRLRLPRERLQQPFAFDRYRRPPLAPQPTDRVLQQATQIRIPRPPERPVHVAREKRDAPAAPPPEHRRPLVSAPSAGGEQTRPGQPGP